ncbi:MAG TPA: hypothetical protein VE077_06430 [Candidatus Methylomirabilis sp.]|nr:hypothetical protein [Candidatus Methylomirabilis sp.]
MNRVLLGGLALVSFGAVTARSKPDPLLFVFHRVDRAQGLAYLRPMIAPDIGVQLESGPLQLERGTVLRCEQSTQTHPAIVEGQTATVTELVLDCGDQKFVVKGLDFSGRSTNR